MLPLPPAHREYIDRIILHACDTGQDPAEYLNRYDLIATSRLWQENRVKVLEAVTIRLARINTSGRAPQDVLAAALEAVEGLKLRAEQGNWR